MAKRASVQKKSSRSRKTTKRSVAKRARPAPRSSKRGKAAKKR